MFKLLGIILFHLLNLMFSYTQPALSRFHFTDGKAEFGF